ncbi:histidine kinase [Virgisporangium aurantiacum]
MSSPLRDRGEFVVAAAVLGTGAGVLNLAYTADWGWILGVLILPAMIVRVFWRSMPGWLLMLWVGVPTFIGDLAVVHQSAYLVVTVALAVVAAGRRSRLDTVVMAACLISPFVIWVFGTHNWNRGIGAWLWAGGMLIGWGFGHVVGQQWALIAELERTRTRLAESAVAADRQRIARDLHDLVGHSFSVVLLHLSGARMILDTGPADTAPADAADALRRAEAVGRTGMDELRQALMLMHQGTHPPIRFGPGELDRLVALYRAAGMRVHLEVTGELDGVAAAPRIVVYDVLREALTNAGKHAPGGTAAVRLEYLPASVVVTVDSSAPASAVPPVAGAGMGLRGMRERVTLLGGEFSAGPPVCDHETAWRVRAELPS